MIALDDLLDLGCGWIMKNASVPFNLFLHNRLNKTCARETSTIPFPPTRTVLSSSISDYTFKMVHFAALDYILIRLYTHDIHPVI